MANRSMNTHRREMRPVTPVGRIGRNAAGAAITAGLLVGGAGVALADNDAATVAPDAAKAAAPVAAPAAEAAAPAAPAALDVAPAAPVAVAAKPVTIPAGAAKQSTDAFGDLDSAAISTQVAKKVEEAKPEAPAADTSDDDATDESSSRSTAKKADKKADKVEEKASKKASKKSSKKRSSDDEDSAPAPRAAGSSIVSTARNGIGVRYVWGGSTRNGWDCSGFTAWVYRQHGINLPHSAAAQRSMGHRISRSEARPGDLVYTPGHIGIYAGNGRIIDAGTSVRRTSERQMWSASWTFVRIGR